MTEERRSRWWMCTAMLVIAMPLCSLAASVPTLQPEGWDAEIRLRQAIDRNPDPAIVEIDLEASVASVEIEPGRHVQAWTYNASLPGPLIRAHVGDRLIVHFKNALPQPTTVHWHGVRVPMHMDGVPGASQPPVQSGESFTYDFTVPDAGLFWYHPHVMSAAQVGFGLYGALLVDDPTEHVGVSDELVLVLSDIDANESGTLRDPEDTGKYRLAFGLEGDEVLVNGRTRPRLLARPGAAQRWRIVNAAKARYFELELPTSTDGTPFVVIGGDGGLYEYPVSRETLVIAPGERLDVIVTPSGTPDSDVVVHSLPFNRGYGSQYVQIKDLFTIGFVGPSVAAVPLASIRREIQALARTGATDVQVDLSLVQLDAERIEYRINGEPMAAVKPIHAALGETQIWTIANQTSWSHPFHLHGFFFQRLDDNGEPVRPLAWKDTINIPFNETVRIIVRFDDRPGSWMVHCHILDHAEGGLMTTVELGTPSSPTHASHAHGAPEAGAVRR